MAQEEGLLVNSKHKFEIGDEEATLNVMAKGFMGFEPATNEEIDQTPYLDGGGWATSTVTSGQLTIEFTGHRYFGDEAQDFLFDKQYSLGTGRDAAFFVWTLPDGATIKGNVTIAEIGGPGGDAPAKGEFTISIHFNGEPVYTAGGAAG